MSSCLLGNPVPYDGGHELNHYVRKFRHPYLAEQVYLNSHPAELQLRNHC